jgi:signal transduction histidine kinase/CheY-like chemotaxis protein
LEDDHRPDDPVDGLQRELRESNRRLRLAQKIARIGNWSLDPAVGVPEWSDEVYRIYERAPADGPFPLAEYRQIYSGADWERFQSAIGAAIDHGQPYDIELRLRLPSGRIKWVHALAEPEPEPGPHGHRVHGTIQDITARALVEQERAELQERLTRSQRLEAVGRLAGGVAHDFNNMLNVIIGHAELVLERLATEDPLRGDLDAIARAARRSAGLTRQLLAFARRQTASPVTLDLNETVAAMLGMLERLIGENIVFRWRPADVVGKVRIDPSQVDQIVTNLVVNARDAIDDVGTITIDTGAVTVPDAGHDGRPWLRPGDYATLTVADDGCGFDEATRARIFEPFFTTKGLGEGTGLGLATVYGIVKQNGGFIEVESAPGRGATFCVLLPVQAEESPGPAIVAEPVWPTATASCRILVVEDEPAILDLMRVMLEHGGHEVVTAATPAAALAIADDAEEGFDLLISDVVMPGLNGRDLAARLRERHPAMKQIFISGYDEDIIGDHGVVASDVNFLQKPMTRQQLLDKIAAVMNGRGGPCASDST